MEMAGTPARQGAVGPHGGSRAVGRVRGRLLGGAAGMWPGGEDSWPESDRAEIYRAKPTPAGPGDIRNHLLIGGLGQAFPLNVHVGQVIMWRRSCMILELCKNISFQPYKIELGLALASTPVP